MRSRIAGIAISAVFTLATSALAQSTTQTPPAQPQQRPADQSQTQQASKSTNAAQTFTGCLMKETDYRRAHNLGSGAMGGVGLGDEFVLTDVKVSPPKNSVNSNSSKSTESTTSTTSARNSQSSASSCADQGTAYRLTGTAEEKIKGLVGHELEIQGRLKKADTTTSASSAANEPAQKNKLPAEVEIISFRETSNRDAMNQPAASASTTPATSPVPAREPSGADQTGAQQPQTSQPQNPRSAAPVPTREPSGADQTGTQPEKHQLPKTASVAPLLALVGMMTLALGLALTMIRRRRPQ